MVAQNYFARQIHQINDYTTIIDGILKKCTKNRNNLTSSSYINKMSRFKFNFNKKIDEFISNL